MDLHYIVDKLNAAPFGYGLTLLRFSEKSTIELLQLVSDVFAAISPKHQKVDCSKEDPDQTVDRLMQFLKIVKYKPNYDPVTFRQLMAAGEKDVIYPILKFILAQPQELEQRAFVGYYLSWPDMPDELNYDADVMPLKEEIRLLQQQFVDAHKQSEAVKNLNKDSQALKAKIKALEEEKQKLDEKVQRAKAQVEKVADRASYMDVCSQLREQLDREVNLSHDLQGQKQGLEKAASAYNKVAARVKELQSSYQEGSAARLLETLTEDVKSLRGQVNERYPKELEKRQKRLQALQEAFSSGVNTEVDLQRLQQQANSLHAQIQEMQEKRAAQDRQRQGDRAFLQLRQAQQMATQVARKKDDLKAKIERLQEKKDTLTAQYEKLTAGAGGGVVSKEEWETKYNALKAAMPHYKKMKKDLGDVEAEVFTLAYTEEVLSEQEAELNKHLKVSERKAGVTGFADVANKLEMVSEQKSALDEAKGMTLQEISKTVEEINAAINDRKIRLQPQIKRLRTVRQQFADLETEHREKKQHYDVAMSQHEGRVAALEQEVSAMRTEVVDNEQKYHLVSSQLTMLDHSIKKVSSGPQGQVLQDRYEKKVAEAEKWTKECKEKQKEIKDSHNTGLGQIDMMNDLIRLLQLKAEVSKRDGGSAGMGGGMAGMGKVAGAADVFTLA